MEQSVAEAANIPGISFRRTQKAKRNASRYGVASEVILSWMVLRIALPWYGSLANFHPLPQAPQCDFKQHFIGSARVDRYTHGRRTSKRQGRQYLAAWEVFRSGSSCHKKLYQTKAAFPSLSQPQTISSQQSR